MYECKKEGKVEQGSESGIGRDLENEDKKRGKRKGRVEGKRSRLERWERERRSEDGDDAIFNGLTLSPPAPTRYSEARGMGKGDVCGVSS